MIQIDGRTAIKQLTSRVSAEKILRTLSNVPEFDVLVEGLDAVTLGDVYKAAFPNGILQLIGAQYLPSFKSSFKHHKGNIFKPVVSVTNATELPFTDEKLDENIGNKTEYPYDEVHEDESQNKNEELKEEPITDDYVYDQPIEDRLKLDLEHVAAENDDESKQKIKDEDGRDSKTLFLEKSQNVLVNAETLKKKEVSKYGGQFRNWITNMLTG